jgi:hypothetical protein
VWPNLSSSASAVNIALLARVDGARFDRGRLLHELADVSASGSSLAPDVAAIGLIEPDI